MISVIDESNPYAAPFAPAAPVRPKVADRPFKFKYLNDRGQEHGLWAKKGEVRDGSLVLEGRAIPMAAIAHTLVRRNRLLLTVFTGPNQTSAFVMALHSGPKGGKVFAEGLKQEIDRAFTAQQAAFRLEALRKEGRAGAFRVQQCPSCDATIDLSGFALSPQVYCRSCDTVSSPPGEAPADEANYHRCEKCGYYSRPAVFATTVVVFLIAAASWWSRQLFICHGCMRREGWVVLGKNLPTLVGAPFALPNLLRAYFGGSARSKTFAGLDTANQHARAGRVDRAEPLYQAILTRTRHAAGVHHDRALARARAGDWTGCLDAIHAAWADCSNYAPALPLALQALQALGRASEAEALHTRWGQV
jgi:hypothetical protein